MDKENQSSLANKVISPPISARLRDLSNNLKSLCSSTPLHIKLPEENDAPFYGQVCTEIVETKTPIMDWSIVDDRWDVANVHGPWETLSVRNSGMKVRSNHFSNTFDICSLDFHIGAHILFFCCRTPLFKNILSF